MAKKTPAQRAKKKHQKEVKRSKKLATRPPKGPIVHTPPNPLLGWDPATEGVLGLAKRYGISLHAAAQLAERQAGKNAYAGADGLWLPTRVAALSTEELLTELGARGVHIHEASFVELTTRYAGGRAIAAEWLTDLAGTVHDHDFVGQAAEELWVRWAGGVVSDEMLMDLLEDAWEHFYDYRQAEALTRWVAVWDQLAVAGGLPRYGRLGSARVESWMVELIHAAFDLASKDAESPLPIRAVEAAFAIRAAGGFVLEFPEVGHAAFVFDQVGRHAEAFEMMIETLAEHRTEADFYDFSDFVLNLNGLTAEMLDRGIALMEAEPSTPDIADLLEGLQERRAELLG